MFFATAEFPPHLFGLYWWLMTTMGAGVMGWSLTLIYLVAVPFGRRERWAHNCLVLRLATWVVLDVAIAMHFRVTGELVYLSAVAVGLAIPLVWSRGYFRHAVRPES